MARTYQKPALSPADLLAHLLTRGLRVTDSVRALRALEYVGYYRLLIYMRPLQMSGPPKTFVPGATFDDVLLLYEFDRELRLLCLDGIERIEVALRAAIVSQVAVQHGPHFFLEPKHFDKLEYFVESTRPRPRRVTRESSTTASRTVSLPWLRCGPSWRR